MPHDHELRPGLPQGPEPRQGDRRGQEAAGRARGVSRLAAAALAAALCGLAAPAGAVAKPPAKPAAPAVQKPVVEAYTPLAKTDAAARAGDANAQTHLGDDYLLGQEGAAKDVVQARHWYELAAAQGQPDAAFVLGEIYWNGDGTAKDNAAAQRWWKVAYEHGRQDAAKLLGDEAFARAKGEGETWSLPALQEALDWYQKDAAIAGPAVQEKAVARVKQVQDLIDYARRQGG
ncbi:MAG: sel1 repeat family protein [Phenylobacterium sp.]|nr:MAG: sel1 repeat family protein [Phenylobacterium sp.]